MNGVRRRTFIILAVAAIGSMSGSADSRMSPVATRPRVFQQRADAEHLYRIVGKVRLLPLWVGADDVGGARITWRQRDRTRALSLLIGSDPQRAPRQLNEWGYIREDVADDAITVFGVRTLTDGETPQEADRNRRVPLAEFGILCSAMSNVEATSRTVSIRVPSDTTYRQLGRVLAAAEGAPRWNRKRLARPSDAAPGFLTALDEFMRVSVAAAADPSIDLRAARFSYVYRDAVYDLFTRRTERVAERRTRSTVFRDLLRSDMAVKKQADGTVLTFSITYGTAGALAGVPIFVQYQPNWWFKIALEFDEGVDVPADPATDPRIRERVEALCNEAPLP